MPQENSINHFSGHFPRREGWQRRWRRVVIREKLLRGQKTPQEIRDNGSQGQCVTSVLSMSQKGATRREQTWWRWSLRTFPENVGRRRIQTEIRSLLLQLHSELDSEIMIIESNWLNRITRSRWQIFLLIEANIIVSFFLFLIRFKLIRLRSLSWLALILAASQDIRIFQNYLSQILLYFFPFFW